MHYKFTEDTEKHEPQRQELKTELNQKKQATRVKADAAKQIQKELRRVEAEKNCMEDRVREINAKYDL